MSLGNDARTKANLATSTHYLRYFILGGYLVLLTQVPNLLDSSLSLEHIALFGLSVSILCIIIDLRNYFKYRELAGMEKKWRVGIVTLILLAFYVAVGLWFYILPQSAYGKERSTFSSEIKALHDAQREVEILMEDLSASTREEKELISGLSARQNEADMHLSKLVETNASYAARVQELGKLIEDIYTNQFLEQKVQELYRMREEGVITDEEYQSKKTEILKRF